MYQSNNLTQLNFLEDASAKVDLFPNDKKQTKYEDIDLWFSTNIFPEGSQLNEVKDFKYLVSYVANSKKVFLICNGQAWNVCNRLQHI